MEKTKGLGKVALYSNIKMGSIKECSNYESIARSSHASKIVFRIFQSKCYQYMDREITGVQAGFRKGRDA